MPRVRTCLKDGRATLGPDRVGEGVQMECVILGLAENALRGAYEALDLYEGIGVGGCVACMHRLQIEGCATSCTAVGRTVRMESV